MIEERTTRAIKATLAEAGLTWSDEQIQGLARHLGRGGEQSRIPHKLPVLERYMRRVLHFARHHSAEDWPFGAMLVPVADLANGTLNEGPDEGMALSASYERRSQDPLAHAEMRAITSGSRTGDLHSYALFTSHEPCAMCAGAILRSKVSMVVIGSRRADRPELFRQRKISLESILADSTHPPQIVTGVLRAEAVALFDGIVPDRWS